MLTIKKIISSFLLPPGFLSIVFAAMSFWFFKRKEKKNAFVFLFLFFFSWIIMSDLFGMHLKCLLEKEYLLNQNPDGDVIVVLGAGVRSGYRDARGRKEMLTDESLERVLTAYFLHKKMKLPVIVTGGSFYGSAVESEVAKDLLVYLGMDEKDIFSEKKSRDTYENAIYSRKICEREKFKKPIIVTSARHIKRSILSFKKAGFKEVSYSISDYSCSDKLNFMDFLPGDMRDLREFVYEILGFYFYGFFY